MVEKCINRRIIFETSLSESRGSLSAGYCWIRNFMKYNLVKIIDLKKKQIIIIPNNFYL